MPITNFIPALWSARILAAMETSLVYAGPGVVNRDYEGEITGLGDRVKINSVGDVTIKAYSKNTDLDAPEELTDAQMELIIDQAKYFNFAVDDVEALQSKPKVMDESMRRASYGLRNVADSFVAALMRDGTPTANLIGTVASPKTDLGTAGKAYDYLVDLGVILDNNDTPQEGRWAVVPPWFHGLLLKDSRFVGAGTSTTDATLRNGMVGEAAGFVIKKSNNVPKATATTVFRILAGNDMATSYADQILKTEAYRPQLRFADAVKGLHVYGAKVVRPAQLAQLIANVP